MVKISEILKGTVVSLPELHFHTWPGCMLTGRGALFKDSKKHCNGRVLFCAILNARRILDLPTRMSISSSVFPL